MRGPRCLVLDQIQGLSSTECPVDGVEVVGDAYAAAQGSHALALLTEWEEFKFLDWDKISDAVELKHVIDARNLLDRGALRRRGFSYAGIGRS